MVFFYFFLGTKIEIYLPRMRIFYKADIIIGILIFHKDMIYVGHTKANTVDESRPIALLEYLVIKCTPDF